MVDDMAKRCLEEMASTICQALSRTKGFTMTRGCSESVSGITSYRTRNITVGRRLRAEGEVQDSIHGPGFAKNSPVTGSLSKRDFNRYRTYLFQSISQGMSQKIGSKVGRLSGRHERDIIYVEYGRKIVDSTEVSGVSSRK